MLAAPNSNIIYTHSDKYHIINEPPLHLCIPTDECSDPGDRTRQDARAEDHGNETETAPVSLPPTTPAINYLESKRAKYSHVARVLR